LHEHRYAISEIKELSGKETAYWMRNNKKIKTRKESILSL